MLAIQPVESDEIIIEYYEPSSAAEKSILHISKVVHGYKKLTKSLLGYGEPARKRKSFRP